MDSPNTPCCAPLPFREGLGVGKSIPNRAAVRVGRVGVEAPGDDAGRRDAEEVGSEAGQDRLAPDWDRLGAATDLDAAYLPRLRYVVHDEGDARITRGVAVFLTLAIEAPADI